jgi:acetyl esterase
MRNFWSYYLRDEVDRLHPLAAPLRAELHGLPPVLIHLAELDPLRSEGEALAAKLRAAGVPVELEIFAGLTHGFMRAAASVTKAKDATNKAGAWLRSVTAPQAARKGPG